MMDNFVKTIDRLINILTTSPSTGYKNVTGTLTSTGTWDSSRLLEDSTLNAGASGGTGTGAGAARQERCKLNEYLATAPIFHHRCHILVLPP